jgi:hypothetical protein
MSTAASTNARRVPADRSTGLLALPDLGATGLSLFQPVFLSDYFKQLLNNSTSEVQAASLGYYPRIPDDHWPPELSALVASAITVEYASLTRSGTPVTVPVTPYLGPDRTIDVSTGLTYPAKAERARRNPRVCLLFADPLSAGQADAPVAVVQGHAAVRDADLQANTDRYARQSIAKLPDATKGQPKFVLRQMAFYYARIWIEITPVRIRWWKDRSLAGQPSEWRAPSTMALPESDPAPRGSDPPAWREPPSDWRSLAGRALADLPLADLTTVDEDGVPLCMPVSAGTLAGGAIDLELGDGAPRLIDGPACLTLHGHPALFTGQENHTLIGALENALGSPRFVVERALADWSLVGNRARTAMSFLAARRSLAPRLAAEAARRGQPVPKVRFG